MTPPCPNCGTVYHESRSPEGRLAPSILSTPLDDVLPGGGTFRGVAYLCVKCRQRWRVELALSPFALCLRA